MCIRDRALLEQFEVQDIETALFLTEHLADYVLTPDLSSPQETAIDLSLIHISFFSSDPLILFILVRRQVPSAPQQRKPWRG